MPKIKDYIQREYKEGDELLTLGVHNGKIAGLFKANDGTSYRVDTVWPTVASLFQAPSKDKNPMKEPSYNEMENRQRIARQILHEQARLTTPKEFNDTTSGSKPTKAILIFDDDHRDISLLDGRAMSSEYINDWCADTKVSRTSIRYVHYDSILFEVNIKAVLAEVGTGIEI